jgi:hypothetical protein
VRTLLNVLGGTWTLPNTALGLLVGVALTFGRPRRVPGRPFLLFASGRGISRAVRRRGPAATTFGQVVVFWEPGAAARSGYLDHEEVHVRQYQVLGPFFLPVYLACLPFTGWRRRHPLERAAYRRGP